MELPDIHPFLSAASDYSLYVHVPFCYRKCGYCNFFSVPADDAVISSTTSRIVRQIEEFTPLIDPGEYRTVYIGGGTPNILLLRDLKRLLRVISRYTGKNTSEWSIEANPEYIDEAFLDVLSMYSVTRLSVGIQSFQDPFLTLLQRQATGEKNVNALEIIRKKWQGELNIDIMCGLPGETVTQMKEDLLRALDAAPDHISLYVLSVEPGTPFQDRVAKGLIKVPGEDHSIRLWETGLELLSNHGYLQYEVSNFALPGKECGHNLRYWQMEPYAGCGPGAVSTLRKGTKVLRIETKETIGGDFYYDTEIIREKEFLLEFLMMGLRLRTGIDKRRFKTIFKKDIDDILGPSLEKLKKDGFIGETGKNIFVTPKGFLLLNSIIVELALEIEKN